MTSTPTKSVNGNGTRNGPLGKRKKSREHKGSYLSKWLDKSLHHIQESTPSVDTFDSCFNGNYWPNNNMQCPPTFDPYRFNIYGGAPEPMSLPTLPTYCNPAMGGFYPDYRFVSSANKSIQVQRPRLRRRNENIAEDVTNAGNATPNCKYIHTKNFTDSQDFASLPPLVTSVGDTTSNCDMNGTDKGDSNGRRFSDPCLRELPDITNPAIVDAELPSETSSGLSGSQVGSKLLTCLLDQITALKVANEKLNKDLQETKLELHSVRQQNSLWQKTSPSNLGASLHNHSPLSNNGFLGATYSPGMVTDVVREIRDAARLREEALYSRVRAMVLERSDTGGLGGLDSKFSERSLDEIKTLLRASDADKRRMLDRIAKLENELRALKVANGLEGADSNGVASPEKTDPQRAHLRKELEDTRRAKIHAEEQAHKLERLVTQLQSKFNGVQISSPNGPDSLASSEPDHEGNVRIRRTSVNSSNNTTVVFGPVTDL